MYLAAELGYTTGIRVDNDINQSDTLWWVSFIVLPNDIGEISWHNPSIMTNYSGYSTDEKYERCAKYIEFIKSI